MCSKMPSLVVCCPGQFIISMFVFVNKLSFTLSCLASIFFYIGKHLSRPFTPLLMTVSVQLRFVCKAVGGKGKAKIRAVHVMHMMMLHSAAPCPPQLST